MMDIYARSGKLDQAESVFNTFRSPDAVKYRVLFKAYAMSKRADRATELFHRMLQESRVAPDVGLFNSLISAWAESSQPDAVEQAFEIMRLMQENEKCLELGVRPDVKTFGALLKCLAASRRSDAGKRAENILDDMEGRSRAGDPYMKPSEVVYNLAVKACFQAGDLERAEVILKRMENSDTPPNLRTYNDILQHYSQIGTPASAERTDQILTYMKDLAKSTASLMPDEISYNIVLAAWARSHDPDAANRMWKIYERSVLDQIKLDTVGYSTLIACLAKSRKLEHIQRADLLLQSMEKSNRLDLQPDMRHFTPVIKGFVDVGDPESATRILMRIAEAYMEGKNNGAKPMPTHFHLVTKAWINGGDLEKATLVLEEMQYLRDTNCLPEGPDLRTYQALQAAWRESTHPNKEVHTLKIRAKIADSLGGHQEP
jgi:pentatricopeptide repeat protein